LVTVKSVSKALHYELHSAPIVVANGVTPGTPGPYTTTMLTSVKQPVTFNNLTPGTAYTFQARAYGKPGYYTDWSDSVQRMCI
jgi:hypothetical protein